MNQNATHENETETTSALIQYTMTFHMRGGEPWVLFQASTIPARRWTSFLKPLAELPENIHQAFFLMEVMEENNAPRKRRIGEHS